jgi:hypothetical protein
VAAAAAKAAQRGGGVASASRKTAAWRQRRHQAAIGGDKACEIMGVAARRRRFYLDVALGVGGSDGEILAA